MLFYKRYRAGTCLFVQIMGLNEIRKPIREKQLRVFSPRQKGRFRFVIVGVIIFRDFDGFSLRFIPKIFVLQRFGIVFGVAGYKNLSSVFRSNGVNARFG